ncbi:LuxR C-terminal-related transcriptional regulator [Curtobacterium sp. MCBD17_035]|uniref:LuxR C-terminal-related transcriptional regulator n=1 Tax=Curtobacterium sp. MCBD17_035 TaxID=2175673 RepID=UPI0011B7BAE2|nr:LuxR C-terminal-related transcriptional regulator [Curtobacterium sp. MCBD17_035]WIB67788.1 LuxR C-terminal-related transcriptional regulator [Curtobacterium sp. MCBD17_035]
MEEMLTSVGTEQAADVARARGGGGRTPRPGYPRPRRFQLRRPRWLEALDDAARAQIVCVRGPAGTGKTTVVADWVDREVTDGGRRVAWHGARETDTRCGLWWSVVAQLRREADGPQPEHPDRDDAPDEEVVAALLTRLDGDEVIVLDEFDRLRDAGIAAAVEDDVAWLLERTRCTVVVVSRRSTAFEGSAVAARFDVEVLDTSGLLFTQQETAAVLTLRGVAFDSPAIAMVHERLSGWPTAVQRLTNQLALEPHRVWHRDELEPVVRRIAVEIVDELTSGLRGTASWPAIVTGAVLPFMNKDMLVRDEGDAAQVAQLLDVAERAGLGAWTRVRGRSRFTLTPVVKRVLTEQLALQEDRSMPDIAAAGARLLEGEGEIREAVGLAAAAQDWPYLAALTRQHYAVLCRDHHAELVAILAVVPRDHMETDPWLLHLQAAMHFADDGGRTAVPAAAFARADAAARERLKSDVGAESVRDSVLRVASLRRAGSFGRALAVARSLPDLLTAMRTTPAAGVRLSADGHMQVGITHLHDGSHEEALQHFAPLARSNEDPHLRIQAMGYSAYLHVLRGDVRRGRELVTLAMRDGSWFPWRHSVWAVPVHVAAALAALETWDLPTVDRHMRVLDTLPYDLEDWPLVVHLRAFRLLLQGDGLGGFGVIRDAEGHYGRDALSNHHQGLMHVLKSDLLLLARQAKAALAGLRPFLDGRESVAGAQARALLLAGNAPHARLFADRLMWRSNPSPRTRTELHVVRAVASCRLGDLDAARTSLDEAATVSSARGLSTPWWLVPRDELEGLFDQVAPHLRPVLADAPSVYSSDLTVPRLTRREGVVLTRLRAQGSIEDIATDLGVSPNTVKTQVRSIYRKLGVGSRAEAVRVAYEWHLMGAPEGQRADV